MTILQAPNTDRYGATAKFDNVSKKDVKINSWYNPNSNEMKQSNREEEWII